MGIFYNPSKIMKLVPFILRICVTSKHKRMPWKDFHQNITAFKAWFVCTLLVFPEFLVDPYYEPLAWLMTNLVN